MLRAMARFRNATVDACADTKCEPLRRVVLADLQLASVKGECWSREVSGAWLFHAGHAVTFTVYTLHVHAVSHVACNRM